MSAKYEPRFHSIASAAAFLGGLSVSTIRRYIAIGDLKAVKVGRRRVMIRESELLGLVSPANPSARKTALSREAVPLQKQEEESR